MVPTCTADGCEREAGFRVYERPARAWRPTCRRHLVELHPSLEQTGWLESGYAKPVALDPPSGPPPAPRTGREEAFRMLVDEAMGWSD